MARTMVSSLRRMPISAFDSLKEMMKSLEDLASIQLGICLPQLHYIYIELDCRLHRGVMQRPGRSNRV